MACPWRDDADEFGGRNHDEGEKREKRSGKMKEEPEKSYEHGYNTGYKKGYEEGYKQGCENSTRESKLGQESGTVKSEIYGNTVKGEYGYNNDSGNYNVKSEYGYNNNSGNYTVKSEYVYNNNSGNTVNSEDAEYGHSSNNEYGCTYNSLSRYENALRDSGDRKNDCD
ncbi:putative mediator of RNA polymerase II transcription subunit 26 [Glycine soja]|uniref:Uncharacterized protein n=1 Tax=Glycine soja TaxID=3848 RepID=A0A0B2R9P5_GLYSO|nr:putative mediator of RNA polymerase II transcription subunit 26 [Glycine soja]KAG4974737.1 hypothetical protein JHK87_031558 [Glycine soja]KAG4994890.1 hypothetical protein JHK86_031717 [Glycine max]KHN28482.1 hypothetical protein glysoja_047845 [Glycine soja]